MSLATFILVTLVFAMLAVVARQLRVPNAVPVLAVVFLIYVTFELFSDDSTSGTTLPHPVQMEEEESFVENRVEETDTVTVENVPVEVVALDTVQESVEELNTGEVNEVVVVEPVIEVEEVGVDMEAVAKDGEPTPAADSPSVVLRKFLICRDVNEKTREVIRPGKEFPGDVGKLFCFTAVKAEALRDSIIHVWYYNNWEMTRVPIEVLRGNFYRVWSHKTILPKWTGDWYVAVINSKGEEIGRKEFRIMPSAGDEPVVIDTLQESKE
ncbi:MAG: DUF2914 domain-containing protein [Fidelibacterota bacterium]